MKKQNPVIMPRKLIAFLKEIEIPVHVFKDLLGLPLKKIPDFILEEAESYYHNDKNSEEMDYLVLKRIEQLVLDKAKDAKSTLKEVGGLLNKFSISVSETVKIEIKKQWRLRFIDALDMVSDFSEELDEIKSLIRAADDFKDDFPSLYFKACRKKESILLNMVKACESIEGLKSLFDETEPHSRSQKALIKKWDTLVSEELIYNTTDRQEYKKLYNDYAREHSQVRRTILIAWDVMEMKKLEEVYISPRVLVETISDLPVQLTARKKAIKKLTASLREKLSGTNDLGDLEQIYYYAMSLPTKAIQKVVLLKIYNHFKK